MLSTNNKSALYSTLIPDKLQISDSRFAILFFGGFAKRMS